MCSLTIECVLLLQIVFSYCRLCSLTTECVLLLENVFSYYRMCSLTTECVLVRTDRCPIQVSAATFEQKGETYIAKEPVFLQNVFSSYRMCSLTIECVLLLENGHLLAKGRDIYRQGAGLAVECVLFLQNVFSYYRMCSLTSACVLLLENVFSYYRMCFLTRECVLTWYCRSWRRSKRSELPPWLPSKNGDTDILL